MSDDTPDIIDLYRPPEAELEMPEGPGGWRDEPAFVSPLQGWRWIVGGYWEIVDERPWFWLALVLLLGGVERVWSAIIGSAAIADVGIRLFLSFLCVPSCAAIVFPFAQRQMEDDCGETEAGRFAALGRALARALPFCPLFAALTGGYIFGAGMFSGSVVPRLPNFPLLLAVILPGVLGSGAAAVMLFALTAEALAIMARLNFFTALLRTLCALAHNCLAFALAALCFFLLSEGYEALPEIITAFAVNRGLDWSWLEPACEYLTGCLKVAILLLAPCAMVRDIFYETGYNAHEAEDANAPAAPDA